MAADLPNNPLFSLVGYHLRRASAAAMDELSRELSTLGLRVSEASVLMLIGANPQIRASEIGRELGIQRANMTPLVLGLEQRALLTREPVDGRSQGLRLTAEGRKRCEAALFAMRQHDARLLRRLQDADAEPLAAALQSMWTSAEDETVVAAEAAA